jgi:hypothetical protein
MRNVRGFSTIDMIMAILFGRSLMLARGDSRKFVFSLGLAGRFRPLLIRGTP